ncbi:hypothetical protein [Methylobacterium sp. GXS13]|nr:hypothetical protein [Methylobacterium sp. GXS13]
MDQIQKGYAVGRDLDLFQINGKYYPAKHQHPDGIIVDVAWATLNVRRI